MDLYSGGDVTDTIRPSVSWAGRRAKNAERKSREEARRDKMLLPIFFRPPFFALHPNQLNSWKRLGTGVSSMEEYGSEIWGATRTLRHELCTMTVEYVLEVTSVLSNAGMIVSPILEGEYWVVYVTALSLLAGTLYSSRQESRSKDMFAKNQQTDSCKLALSVIKSSRRLSLAGQTICRCENLKKPAHLN